MSDRLPPGFRWKDREFYSGSENVGYIHPCDGGGWNAWHFPRKFNFHEGWRRRPSVVVAGGVKLSEARAAVLKAELEQPNPYDNPPSFH
jgi:hypothetical protein